MYLILVSASVKYLMVAIIYASPTDQIIYRYRYLCNMALTIEMYASRQKHSSACKQNPRRPERWSIRYVDGVHRAPLNSSFTKEEQFWSAVNCSPFCHRSISPQCLDHDCAVNLINSTFGQALKKIVILIRDLDKVYIMYRAFIHQTFCPNQLAFALNHGTTI